MNLKFKNRIAFFNTLAVAVTTALVFWVIYIVVSKTAYAHLDNDILLEKEEVFSNLDWRGDTIIINKMPEWDEAEHSKVEVNPTFLQIVDNNRKVIFHSTNMLKDQFLFNPHNAQETFYSSDISGQKIRLGQFPIKNEKDKIIGQLTIAISQQESYTILNNLILLLLFSYPFMLIIQFIASSVAASKAIEPVHQLIKTASGISDSNISTRLPIPVRKDELHQLTTTINELLSRIEASMLQQKQFTSDASHEIRTPLASIRGTLEVLIRKPRESAIYEEKITDIIRQVDRLDSLLDQLLQLARIESGVALLKKETVVLSTVISTRLKKWQEAADNKKISLDVQLGNDITVPGDKFYIELILDNLINNAIKYGKENGHVIISWNPVTKSLDISDDGEGIAKENLPHIFNRFYRTDESRSSVVKGSGLGLSIAKKLADLHHIALTVDSELGSGTTFSMKFPH